MNNEDIARMIDDRNQSRNDVVSFESQIRMFESMHPDDYEEHDEWNSLHSYLAQASADVEYLTNEIDTALEGNADG